MSSCDGSCPATTGGRNGSRSLPACGCNGSPAGASIPDLAGEPLILYPNLPLPGLAQQVMQAFAREGTPLQEEQEVDDVLTAIALVAGGFGACITTASSESLPLPGVVRGKDVGGWTG